MPGNHGGWHLHHTLSTRNIWAIVVSENGHWTGIHRTMEHSDLGVCEFGYEHREGFITEEYHDFLAGASRHLHGI